jgi:protease PrsW
MNNPYGRPPGPPGHPPQPYPAPQQGGYAPQQGYPQQGGHAPQQGYPQQGGHAPQQGYPQQGGARAPHIHSQSDPPYGHVQAAHGHVHQQSYPPPHGYGTHQASAYPPVALMPDPDRTRRTLGLWLWIVGIGVGAALNLIFTLFGVVSSGGSLLGAMFVGALFAFPPLVVYLFVPMVVDRYDPEPWWCLLMAFLWGALAATGFSILINTGVHVGVSQAFGEHAGELASASVSAPLAEEFWKGLGVFGFFYFLRREFDGIVDGIIYATFCALGFAAVENVLYYARAAMQGGDVLTGTFVLRGVFTPWLHPLFTSMTGIGFGIARESAKTSVRVIAPFGGYAVGTCLHAVWNFLPTALGRAMGELFLPWLLLWLCFVAAFFGIIVALVIRKGRVIRDNLRDEVELGMLTQDELELVCSPVGRLRCTFGWRGAAGRSFIRAGARLALSKWHTARAMRGQKRTISVEFIGPLRQEIAQLRQQLLARAPH